MSSSSETHEDTDVPALPAMDGSCKLLPDDRPRRVSPGLKKAEQYRRDRHTYSVSAGDQRSWSQKKILRKQTWRRGVDRSLRPALFLQGSSLEEFSPAIPRLVKSKPGAFSGTEPLGIAIDRKLERRIALHGVMVAAARTPEERWRLTHFLEALMQGKSGHAVELARYFAMTLRERMNPDWCDDSFGYERIRRHRWYWRHALSTLFEHEPIWQDRLHEWITRVLGTDPSLTAPAWKRVRNSRRRARIKR